MELRNFRNKSVNLHQFSMVPKFDIPRSTFLREFNHKTTFDENWLIPLYVDEVLPGDTFSLRMTAFARLTTPIFPIMDNMFLDSFFFFVPNRLLWSHWVNFMGEQANPADSISFTLPTVSLNTGAPVGNLYNYMGIPNNNQITGGTLSVQNLPARAYNKIYNDWFRDENLNNSVQIDTGDGPDSNGNYNLVKRGKRHDYFTACLPWTQKGGVAVTLPLGTSAVVRASGTNNLIGTPTAGMTFVDSTGTLAGSGTPHALTQQAASPFYTSMSTLAATPSGTFVAPGNLYADLSTATAATINQLRQSFQIQKFLERDARSGTRYPELIRAHFGVVNPDFRLQRSEYLGGGTTPVNIAPIPQTSATTINAVTGTPLGTLAAYGTTLAQGHGFTQSFTEHGQLIGLINIRADINYQQGIRKMWSRSTRYDFYTPEFSMLGEQAVLNQEIYAVGTPAQDTAAFGYQERWAEMRFLPNMITGFLNSKATTPLDAWHLAESFASLPTLGATFIQQNTPIARISASATANQHFICDAQFNIKTTRAMPLYSVPGMIDHF